MRTLTVTSLILAAAAAPLVAQSPEAVLDHAIATYKDMRTARVTFTQQVTNALTGSSATSHGELLQRRPGYLAVNFTDPKGDRIVADGKWVWIYLPSTNPGQVIRQKLDANQAGVPDITAQLLDDPKSRYDVSSAGTATVAGHATHAITLAAKSRNVPFSKATLWVDDDDGVVRQFETTDQNGLVRRVTVDSIRLNAPIAPSAFSFQPPRGVKVFDQSGTD